MYKSTYQKRVFTLLFSSHTLVTEESSGLGLLDFPVENLPHLVTMINTAPSLSVYDAVTKLYPYKLFLPADGQRSVLKKIFDTTNQDYLLLNMFLRVREYCVERKDHSYLYTFFSGQQTTSVDHIIHVVTNVARSVEDTLHTFNMSQVTSHQMTVDTVRRSSGSVSVDIRAGRNSHSVSLPAGTLHTSTSTDYVSTSYHDTLLSQLLLSQV